MNEKFVVLDNKEKVNILISLNKYVYDMKTGKYLFDETALKFIDSTITIVENNSDDEFKYNLLCNNELIDSLSISIVEDCLTEKKLKVLGIEL